MEKKLEYLRQILYSAIDLGDADKILKASQELDVEIVRIMNLSFIPYKDRDEHN